MSKYWSCIEFEKDSTPLGNRGFWCFSFEGKHLL